jgi:hypothetical protein
VFHIDWTTPAIGDLVSLWNTADSEMRSAITASISAIEKALLTDPSHLGESREPETRIFFIRPLCIKFHVNVRLQEVLISSVRIGRRH